MPDPVYLFFDEAGNFDFSPSGTRYFVLGVLSTRDPRPLTAKLTSLRYEIFDNQVPPERFHCSEDRQAVRDQVFAAMREVGGFSYDAVVVEKAKTDPALYGPLRFFPKFACHLLDHVFERYADADPVLLVTDTLPVNRKRQAMEKAFKLWLASQSDGRTHDIAHHPSMAHACLQAADYLNWAIYRKWTNDDTRSYDLISRFVASEIDIFGAGTTRYY